MLTNVDSLKIHPDSLTSLRFFAVMLIVAHHLRQPFFPHLLADERFDNAGIIGVTFFLLLSGFILPLNYGRCRSLKGYFRFLWNRIVRIYPVHVFTFILSFFILILQHDQIKPSIAVINILLLQAYFPYQRIFFSFNSVSWILSTLFLFYLLFQIVNRQRTLLQLVMTLSLLCPILSIALIEKSQTKPILWLLYIFPPNRLVVCLTGVIASYFFLTIYQRHSNSLNQYTATILEIISLILFADFIFWGNLTVLFDKLCLLVPFKKSLHFFNIYYLTSTIPVFFILITFGFERGFISRLLIRTPFVFLGKISFAIFMFHQLFFRFLEIFRESLFNTLGVFATIVIAVITVIPFSFLTYHYIENPVRNKLRIILPEATNT